jgi:hypothetical protein
MPKSEEYSSPITISPVERTVTDQVFDEWMTEKRNNQDDDADFEAIIDLLECRRNERDYEWMSDVFIPEYPSIHLTEASQWANQYFQTRDFVEVYLSGTEKTDKQKADLAKDYINTSLNLKDVYHYIKYMRLRAINSTRGACYALCRWDREEKDEVYTEQIKTTAPHPETGVMTDQYTPTEKTQTKILKDHFNYEPIDPRNIVTDRSYAYTLQQKRYIIIRDEVSYEQLLEEAKSKGYINLDKVKKMREPYKTDAMKDTYDKFEEKENPQKTPVKFFDRLLRLGKMWAVVTKRGEDEYPIDCKPGYDDLGGILEGADLIECILEEVYVGDIKVLIRFQPNPYRDSKGHPFRPIVRGLCYVSPTRDVGMSDGRYSRELQTGLNDIVNMSNDRTKLATLPTLKGQQNAIVGNDQIYFEPEHIIPLPNIADLEEMEIKDNPRGAVEMATLFINKMQQVNSVYPTTMGQLPGQASTTATAIAGADTRSNLRANYKALTFEYTFFAEFYWMMLQMAYQFMHPETALMLWHDNAQYFDPDADYTFEPVSSNVEQEYSKDRKVQRYDQILGRIAKIPNPAIVPIIAYIIGQQCTLLGAEYQEVAELIQALAKTPNTPEGGEPPAPKDAQGMPESNQTGNQMSIQEQGTRGMI